MRERAFCVISSPMLLERFPEVQSLDPKDKWRLIDNFGVTSHGRWRAKHRMRISSSFLRSVFRITWSTLRKDNRRTTFLHDWPNISASGSNLSPGSGSRPVGGMDAIRGDFARAR